MTACAEPAAGNICATADDCPDEQQCLTEFRGGYCGTKDCTSDDDCLDGTMCVTHEGANYCFLKCVDKVDCNANRPADQEANCVANVEAVGTSGSKACVPPSGE
jgi:hypothetical protein